MTVTSSASTPARRLRTRLALLTALVLGFAPAVPATAATSPLNSLGVVFTAAPTDGGVLVDGQPLTVALHASNLTSVSIASGDVRIAVTDTPLATRTALREWLADPEPDAAAREIGTATVGGLDAYAERTETATIDPDAAGLRGLAPGVYPLTATFASARGDRTAASVLVVPDAAAQGGVGVIMPITLPARSVGLLTSGELAAATAAAGDLRAQLDAVAGTPAVLAVDPSIVASIRVLGAAAPLSARVWLADLIALPNPRFALQFADADLAAQVGAGLSTPLSVTSLGVTTTGADPSPSPAPTSDQAAPSLDELLDIGGSRDGFFWPATGTAGTTTVTALASLGTPERPVMTLVPSSVVADAPSGRAGAGDAQLLVYDADVSGALRGISVATDSVERGRSRAAASAFTALANAQTPGGNLLVTIDRGSSRSAGALGDAVGAAFTLTGRAPTGIDTFLDADAAAVTLSDVPADPVRVAAVTDFLTDETQLGSFSSILADPSVLTGPERTAILQLLGNAWLPDAAGFSDAVAEHRAASRRTLAAVKIMQPSGLTLAASSSSLGFTVRNELPWPVSLVLITTPNDPRVIVQNTTPIQIGARQNSRAEVPIQARVGSGESNLTVQLRSPTMIAVSDPVSVDVSVRAEWESVGIVVLISLIAVMIVLGVIRTVARRRRRAREEAADG